MGLELGLIKLGFVGVVLLGKVECSQPFLHGLVSLFGFLTVSAIVVLLNSLLVLVIVKTLELTKPKGKAITEEEKEWGFFLLLKILAQKVYLVPEGRAPPLVT